LMLVIKSVSHTDTGIYYCIAKVHGDLAVLPFYLTVQESSSPPPGQDTSITPIEGFAGSPISLPCTASGSPDAEINWILPNNNIVSFQGKSSRISQASYTDRGIYKCIGSSAAGADTVLVHLHVLQQRSSQEVMYGGDLKVDCVASGLPNPEISWALPDGTMVNPVKQREHNSGGRSRRYEFLLNGEI
uniref:Ig-like domain-containing protein n=1 Tax=Lates calcarifer TaxID=8187 RepID=A0A4W6EED0_LATCA